MNPQFRLLIFFVLSTALLISCKDQREIRMALKNVYDLDPELSESKDVSEELRLLLSESCLSHKKLVAQKIENKKTGRRFLSSGKCGYTTYRISDINIHYNKATALISLIDEKDNKEWIDTVKLVYQKRWKVDDVNFNKINSPFRATLKEILQKSKREVHC